jgi:hypothetical protein
MTKTELGKLIKSRFTPFELGDDLVAWAQANTAERIAQFIASLPDEITNG